MRVRSTQGFTLIELLIVVVIIGILAAVAIPKFTDQKAKAMRSSGLADLRNLSSAQESFYIDSNRYAALADTGLLRFTPTRGNTGFAMAAAGTYWNAILTLPDGKKCAVKYGSAAPDPSGWGGPLLVDGVAACEN